MKKGSKPLIFFAFFLLVTYSLLILGYVAVKQECDLLVNEKVESEKAFDLIKNKQVSLIAETQNLISEERIVKIATEELNMIKRTEPKILLNVSKEKIEKINEELKEKYE
jgi:cell division protein FtsL